MPVQRKKVVQADDLYKLEVISSPRISPDGEKAVYCIQRIDRKTEKKFNNLWIVSTLRGAARQFTYGDQNDTSPRWSPDGRQIAFLSNRADTEKPAQIYLIPVDGGEARKLTEIEGKITGFTWSPDGKQLVCTVIKLDEEEKERLNDEQKKKLGVVSRHYDRVFYKLDDFGYKTRERMHIWTVNANNGRARQLTDHEVFDEFSPTYSPDSKTIVFMSNRSKNPDFKLDSIDLYKIPAEGGRFRKVNTFTGEKDLPSYSPDGKWIAFYAIEGEGLWYRNTNLWVVPASGRGNPVNLTEKFDFHVSPWTINDIGAPETIKPLWSKNSTTLYFPVVKHGKTSLFSIDVDGENLTPLIDEEGVVASYDFDENCSKVVYHFGAMQDPGQIHLLDLDSGRSKKLTNLNRSFFRNLDLGVFETEWIDGPAGNKIQGWILKPPGFNPRKKYPSILEIHGGPLTQYGYFFMHEFYFLAASGYVVHFCNPRGGRGYGEKHAAAIWGDWGGADYDDLQAWTDHVAGLSYIDTKRMGVTGGSYGGYMTVWIIGHTNRFKAAVTQRCVSNFTSMWGSSDFNWSFQLELQAGAPFEDLDKFWAMSPIKYIGNAKTPTLVIHSENDLRCPIEQGEQVFVALKRLGVDSEFVRFPEEFHGLSRNGRTDRRVVRLNHILRWFDKYLQ
jgi:dipeptidyl aminopeptidase/acylaminoacyl peptidase